MKLYSTQEEEEVEAVGNPFHLVMGRQKNGTVNTKVLEKQEKDRGLGLCSEEGNGKRSSRFPSGLSLRTVHASSHRAGREKGIEDEHEQTGAGLT